MVVATRKHSDAQGAHKAKERLAYVADVVTVVSTRGRQEWLGCSVEFRGAIPNMVTVELWFHLTRRGAERLALNQSIRDGESETLVSEEGTFEAGFFSPGTSTGRYLGIWYRNVSPLTVVWVANREKALQNNSGVLKLDERGVLVILNGMNSTIWRSNNISNKVVKNPIAQLLDSGNLVVKNEQDINEDNFLWQSFDYPCDTFLPGMKLGWNLVTGLDRTLSSWKNEDDPAKGEYSLKLDLRGYPQFFGYKGGVVISRGGSWNGLALVGYPIHQLTQEYIYDFVFNEKEVYYEYKFLDRSIIYIFTLTPTGGDIPIILEVGSHWPQILLRHSYHRV
ncbi:G-type lectin S-receptor serine/threonine-protein kinase [Spatholobus suberectus]|nr:G-type lectin S-receptor serine/threonine-protein kinase [Spatholobus suberectus]